jgi:arylsulfatase A-like enzyme
MIVKYTCMTILLCVCGMYKSLSAAGQPNIIVIVSDDLGYSDLSYTGNTDYTTPEIDALIESGIWFSNGYVSHPYCSPSRAGIMTGRYQQRFGHEHNVPWSPENPLFGTSLDETLMSEVFQDNGYATAVIGKWHLGDHPHFTPPQRGADHYFGFSSGGYNYYGATNKKKPGDRIMRNDEPVAPGDITYLTDDFTDEAVAFIRQNTQKPFFLYLAYNAVHAPNQATQYYLDQTEHIVEPDRSVYAAITRAMDEGIGRVIDALERYSLRDNTLVVFINDNGGRKEVAYNRPFRGHKGMLYEGGIRVPFCMSWPKHIFPGGTYDALVSGLDIMPTALAVAGINTDDTARPFDGVNLIPYLIAEPGRAPHEQLFWRVIGGQGWAVRTWRYKLVKSEVKDELELYDMQNDPGEMRDIANQNRNLVGNLRRQYFAWNRELIEPIWSDDHEKNCLGDWDALKQAREKALPAGEKAGN